MAGARIRNRTWSIDPDKMARALNIKAAQVPRVVVLELGRRIMRRTPVQHPDFIAPGSLHRSGNLKVNWRYGEGLTRPVYDPAAGTASPIGVDDSAQVAGLTASVQGWRMGTFYAVLNATPYALTVERGGYPNPPIAGSLNYKTGKFEVRTVGGFSKQAPRGMVRVTIGEFQGIANAAAARERAKGLRV